MLTMRRAGIAAALASAVALTGAALPAQAATTPTWRQVYSKHLGPPADYSGLNAVVATGKASAWTFGGSDESGGDGTQQKPLILGTTNGKTWTAATLPSGLTSYFTAASAPAANDIWAATFWGGWVVHYDGHHWKLAHHFTGAGQITAVTAFSASNVWVFGGPGAYPGLGAWHYNGSTWTQVKATLGGGVSSASALSAKDIWAVGASAQAPDAIVERYNGTSWKEASTKGFPTGQWQLTAIRAVSDSNVWVTATEYKNSSNVPYLLHYNGTKWSTYALPWAVSKGNSSDLRSIALDGAGGLWFTGDAIQSGPGDDFATTSYVVHRTASGSWQRIATGSTKDVPPKFTTTGAGLGDLALIPGTKSLWGAGASQSKTTGGNAVIWAYGTV
jgi:hypothetical protein